ncbi:uncharacterized protein C10orf105 homolog [Dromaius novaehollandiae]|uniref:Uncharacterized protein n=1 Tax=Dromaius novaehollandiae TaxID=8790 RepID=A0A8C4KHP8_DRONO|nr:uncharacterized protein C10orf105 homolog [Dromaius novaehollandiae]
MSTEDVANGTSPAPTLLGFLVSTTAPVPPSTASPEKADPLPIIVALVCIFLLLASCLVFVALCKPAALDGSRYGPRECMPYHAEDASEPQLRLWKRLGSLRRSLGSFRRSRPVSQSQHACPRRPPARRDWDSVESTKM